MSYGTRGLDDEQRLDRQVHRAGGGLTTGSSCLHALDPAEMVMALEEARLDPASLVARERDSLREEIFSGLAEYLFADGPEPWHVLERVEGFIKSFAPEIHAKIKGPAVWVTEEEVGLVLAPLAERFARLRASARGRGGLFTWARAMGAEIDQHCVAQSVAALLKYLVREGLRRRVIVAVCYGTAKALRPHLIAGMSLESLARLCGDKGRATMQARIKRIYNQLVEASGAKACQVHFQKSAEASAIYSRAQMGNQNRRKKRKKGSRGGAEMRRRE